MGHIKMFCYAFFYAGISLSPFFEVDPVIPGSDSLTFILGFNNLKVVCDLVK